MNAKDTIYQIIHQQGYIAVDRYFQIASDAYYKNNQAVGTDFTTSPEISQLFGEAIGVWVVQQWIEKGSPAQCNLLELGPGKGTLMSDLIRATKHIEGFHASLNVYLYDINPELIQIQQDTLYQYDQLPIYWIDNLNEIRKLPTIVIGNEFFDCLPAKQYIFEQDDWCERTIILQEQNNLGFSKIIIDNALNIKLKNQHRNVAEGAIVEISNKISEFIQTLSTLDCLSCVFIDYGYNIEPALRQSTQYNSTLQGIKSHKSVDIFNSIGKSDLTFHVDFLALKESAIQCGINLSVVTNQREFLINYGIEHRLNMFIQKQSFDLQHILTKQYLRLTSLGAMGDLFKVLILYK